MDGWSQIHGWLASRPARFFKKGLPGSIHPTRRRQPFFLKILAGQPTMHLDPPIHFGCISIGIGILLDVFSFIFYIFSLKQVPEIQERVFVGGKKEPLLGNRWNRLRAVFYQNPKTGIRKS